MMVENEIRKYLPKYLSEENYKILLNELKSFPRNIDGRMYSIPNDQRVIFQGDGIKNMPVVDLSNVEKGTKKVNCLILSNTCDIDTENKRLFSSAMMYAPIIDLSKYVEILRKKGVDNQKINSHISDLREQRITQILFLPKTTNTEDSIVFLDRILHIDNKYIDRNTLNKTRLFSLSDYGFYLLVFKLSVHFSRIQEKVNRGHCI